MFDCFSNVVAVCCSARSFSCVVTLSAVVGISFCRSVTVSVVVGISFGRVVAVSAVVGGAVVLLLFNSNGGAVVPVV